MNTYRLIQGDCCDVLKSLDSGSVDCVVTDPPYGMSFMGKSWDKVLPPKEAFSEMFRVLKAGALAFVMSSPRQDLLWRMMSLLEGVGFELRQSPLYWAYASGFPKAYDVSKGIDKKSGLKRIVGGERHTPDGKPYSERYKEGHGPSYGDNVWGNYNNNPNFTLPSSDLAKKWDGWKSQTGLKPAVEVILMVNKPRSEKTIVDQVLKTGTGAMNVDACRIPFVEGQAPWDNRWGGKNPAKQIASSLWNPQARDRTMTPIKGRFPANLLVSDDVLDTGKTTSSTSHTRSGSNSFFGSQDEEQGIVRGVDDEGGFSRYFSLDAWWQKTYPFLIVPKASKSERDEGLEGFDYVEMGSLQGSNNGSLVGKRGRRKEGKPPLRKNIHPTVKPLKLMSYLITLGCPPNGTVLDPFVGSGTTLVASWLMGKSCVGIEINEEYCGIADAKMRHFTKQRKLNREVEYSYEVMAS